MPKQPWFDFFWKKSLLSILAVPWRMQPGSTSGSREHGHHCSLLPNMTRITIYSLRGCLCCYFSLPSDSLLSHRETFSCDGAYCREACLSCSTPLNSCACLSIRSGLASHSPERKKGVRGFCRGAVGARKNGINEKVSVLFSQEKKNRLTCLISS